MYSLEQISLTKALDLLKNDPNKKIRVLKACLESMFNSTDTGYIRNKSNQFIFGYTENDILSTLK